MEREACEQADGVIALTSADKASLVGLLASSESEHANSVSSSGMGVLNPPLRSDIAALALQTKPGAARRFITLCARISEEKRVFEYIGIVTAARYNYHFNCSDTTVSLNSDSR